MILRDYQEETRAAVLKEFETVRSTLVVLPTGAGKTVVAAEIIKHMYPRRSMFIAHRDTLIRQAKVTIEDHAQLKCDIEMADQKAEADLFHRASVVISTVQTQISGRNGETRMKKFDPAQFGFLIIDECFPAGTLVDGIPIELLRPGDRVRTHLGFGTVQHCFKRPATRLVRISLEDGNEIVCTPNHPFWTQYGWTRAIDLTPQSMVLSITTYELCDLQPANRRNEETLWQEILSRGILASDNRPGFQSSRRSNNAFPKDQRNERSCYPSESQHETSCHGMETANSRRKWPRSDDSAVSSGFGVGLGNGNCDSNRKTRSLSNLLQSRYWKPGLESSSGSGWKFSRRLFKEVSRQEKGRLAELLRVASVEILKFRSREEFERVCPDGFVYNLEVSNGNTYFANGILVHNCHHYASKGWKKVLDHYLQNPDLKVLGISATPDRSDEEALGQIFESVAYDYEILDAIHAGWLVPIHQQMVKVSDLDFSHVKITAGDLNGAQLAAVMESEKPMQRISGATIDIIGQRRAIVFTASVAQAEMTSNILNRHRQGMSEWIFDGTPREERPLILKRFAEGKTQVVCNCGILTEGFDDVGVECCVMARPTKSRSLYAQMIGRTTRPLKGVVDGPPTAEERKAAIAASAKPNCLVLDFVGNAGRHKLMTSADILGGKVSDEAIARAIKKAEDDGGEVRMDELLDRSEEEIRQELEKRRFEEEARKAKLIGRVKWTSQTISPFDVFDLQPVKERAWDHGRRLSEKQSNLLVKQGIDPASLSYTEARQVIGELFNRWNGDLCGFKQAKILKSRGYSTKVTRQEASAIIDIIANREGWPQNKKVAA